MCIISGDQQYGRCRVARIKTPSGVPGEPAKYRHLGYFATEEEAARAYDAQARGRDGALPLNFPGDEDRCVCVCQEGEPS
jgi:hypothetical protein